MCAWRKSRRQNATLVEDAPLGIYTACTARYCYFHGPRPYDSGTVAPRFHKISQGNGSILPFRDAYRATHLPKLPNTMPNLHNWTYSRRGQPSTSRGLNFLFPSFRQHIFRISRFPCRQSVNWLDRTLLSNITIVKEIDIFFATVSCILLRLEVTILLDLNVLKKV